MSSEILGEAPVVDHPVDGQPELVSMKVTSPDSGTVAVYPVYETEDTEHLRTLRLKLSESRHFNHIIQGIVLTIFSIGMAFGIGIGYLIWR